MFNPETGRTLGATQLNRNLLIFLDADYCDAQFVSCKIRYLKINCITPKGGALK